MRYPTAIAHYGIKGMQKGKRRWTNEDGSLNEAGKQRYKDGKVSDSGYKTHSGVSLTSSEYQREVDYNSGYKTHSGVSLTSSPITPSGKARPIDSEYIRNKAANAGIKSSDYEGDNRSKKTITKKLTPKKKVSGVQQTKMKKSPQRSSKMADAMKARRIQKGIQTIIGIQNMASKTSSKASQVVKSASPTKKKKKK